jgi:hypothetical protein
MFWFLFNNLLIIEIFPLLLKKTFNYLFTEAKVDLLNFIKTTQETLADPDKVQGRLSKDDKVSNNYIAMQSLVK